MAPGGEILLNFIRGLDWLPEFGEMLRWNCGDARVEVWDAVS